MSILINVQPGSGTSVQLVHGMRQPPALAVHDGATTLLFSPAHMPGGLAGAVAFARELAGAVARWEAGCRSLAAQGRHAADPLARPVDRAG